jgi:hypothetical protein
MSRLKEILIVILHPSTWAQEYRYSEVWDTALNHFMETEKFKDIGEHTATIGGVVIWIANHPYASFSTYGKFHVRPKRATILRARKKLMNDLIEVYICPPLMN